MRLLGANFSVVNTVAPNNGFYGVDLKQGKKEDGAIYQFNDGKEQKQELKGFGAGDKRIIAADANDKFTLTGGGWDQGTYQVDDQTGIGGMYYKNKDGSEILISGGSKVDIQA